MVKFSKFTPKKDIYEKFEKFLSDDAEKSTISYTVLTGSKQHLHNTKKRRPNIEHWCGAGQVPSEGQVRTSHNSRVLKRDQLCVP